MRIIVTDKMAVEIKWPTVCKVLMLGLVNTSC